MLMIAMNRITGIAWAQAKGIEKVEVRVDHGERQPAELSTEVNVDTWRMFRLRGRWEPGNHVAEVRATDKTGYTQTTDRAAPIPDGASGWHSVRFTVLPVATHKPAAADCRSDEDVLSTATNVSYS
jgi:hypothetical protein